MSTKTKSKGKLPVAFKEKWLKALRGGRYKQTNGRLRDINGYCCLGVACRVAGIPAKKINGGFIHDYVFGASIDLLPTILHKQTNLAKRLANMNDDGKSFKEIADYIEEKL